MAKHSPGPWHLGEDGVIVADGTGDPVGIMVPRRSILAEACRVRADRVLQTQAPSMLDALCHVVRHNGELTHADLARISAIITEAGGAV